MTTPTSLHNLNSEIRSDSSIKFLECFKFALFEKCTVEAGRVKRNGSRRGSLRAIKRTNATSSTLKVNNQWTRKRNYWGRFSSVAFHSTKTTVLEVSGEDITVTHFASYSPLIFFSFHSSFVVSPVLLITKKKQIVNSKVKRYAVDDRSQHPLWVFFG